MTINRISYEIRENTLIYEMPKELDHHVAQELCRHIDMLVETNPILELSLDFRETEFMDSSGIGVIIGRHKTMQFRKGKLSVMHLGNRVETIFRAAGLHRIVEVKEDEEC